MKIKEYYFRLILIVNFVFCNQLLFAQSDPFWDFDMSRHIRPKINPIDYYTLKDIYFLHLIVSQTPRSISSVKINLKDAKQLNSNQKSVYLLWLFMNQIDYGLIEFFNSEYKDILPRTIAGLNFINAPASMKNYLERLNNYYLNNKKNIPKSQNDVKPYNLGADWDPAYKVIYDLERFRQEYYLISDETLKFIEELIRKNPKDFCVMESREEFDENYTGEFKNYGKDSVIKESLTVVNGIPEGLHKLYYDNGQLREINNYRQGSLIKDRDLWYENGNIQIKIRVINGIEETIYYYSNGNIDFISNKRIVDDKRVGKFTRYYENGSIMEIAEYDSLGNQIGKDVEFYKNGMKKLECKIVDGTQVLYNFWMEDGTQTVIEGSGTSEEIVLFLGKTRKTICSYNNYKENGIKYIYEDGRLIYSDSIQDDKIIRRTTYSRRGTISEEMKFGNIQNSYNKRYRLFKNPKVIFNIDYNLISIDQIKNDSVLIKLFKPQIINKHSIEKKIIPDTTFFGTDYLSDEIKTISCTLKVNKWGKVIELFKLQTKGINDEAIINSLKRLKFKPLYYQEQPVEAEYEVIYKCYLAESMD